MNDKGWVLGGGGPIGVSSEERVNTRNLQQKKSGTDRKVGRGCCEG